MLIVTDVALGIKMSRRLLEHGLTHQTAQQEIVEYCEGVDDKILQALTWPELSPWLSGWLDLAMIAQGTDSEYVYMMYAERLVDGSTEVNNKWIDENIRGAERSSLAKQLLAGRDSRVSQSNWD